MERPPSTPTGSVTWASGVPLVADEVVQRALQAALCHRGHVGRTVDVVFVGDDALAEMHGTFLGDPTATDVITFDLTSKPGEVTVQDAGPDGELYVSVDTARRVAKERGVSLEREICLYVVHGGLHLAGMDDHDPAERQAMRAAEAEVMEGLGFEPDSAPHDVD